MKYSLFVYEETQHKVYFAIEGSNQKKVQGNTLEQLAAEAAIRQIEARDIEDSVEEGLLKHVQKMYRITDSIRAATPKEIIALKKAMGNQKI
ncbi:MAG TPA: hypothetical protein VJB08_04860 [Candidatus Nanoarchaeia archaeon]|nr:hypothetical protein [Candidatus Nanoarchaeia archaeon]